MEFLATTPAEVQRLKGTIQWLDGDVTASLKRRVEELEGRLGQRRNGHSVPARLQNTLLGVAKKADFLVQQRLGSHREGRWLDPYMAMRGRIKHLVIGPRGTSIH